MKSRRLVLGIAVVTVGALTLVEAMGLIDLDWSWLGKLDKYVVPVLILLVGAKIIESSRKLPYTQNMVHREMEVGKDGKRLTANLYCSASQFIMAGKDFPGADMNITMAGATMDLRGANIQEECEINVRSFCGGLELWVSPDIRVEVRSNCFFGGVSNHILSAPDTTAKTIILNANCFFGGVDIKG